MMMREGRHPIRVVAQRTGLTPDVLRAWEKRYGVVEPTRSESGQRLYTDEDVGRLSLLRRVTEAGRSIGRVAKLSAAELSALAAEDEAHRREAERNRVESTNTAASEHLAGAMAATRALDAAQLDAVLVRSALRLGSAAFLEHVAVPLLREIGDLWHAGQLNIAHEHLASTATQRVLGWLLWSGTPNRDGPVIVIGTPAGQRHEIGAMMVAAVATEEGWRVVYLGADLPAEEVARAAETRGAAVVALSVVYPEKDPRLVDELQRLRSLLPARIPILVGGTAASSYAPVLREIRALQLAELSSLRKTLGTLSDRAA